MVGLLLSAVLAETARAATSVNPGFDLFTTSSAQFDFGPMGGGLQSFVGNPLGTFDFGGGVQSVGSTDTIVQRIDTAQSGVDNVSKMGGSEFYPGPTAGEGVIDIELVALSLRSVNPIDIGGGAEIILATLSSDLGSEMLIKGLDSEGDPHGTFDSTLDLLILFTGQTTGNTFAFTVPKTLVATDQLWRHAPTGSPVINGVNHLLNTTDETNDFWPVGLLIHDDGQGTEHVVTIVPLPAAAWMAVPLLGGLGVTQLIRRRRLAA